MIELSYVSLFSGIEAFSVAASRVEGVRWNPVFFSEIDPFPCAVLAHHFPTVPNLGDICKIRVEGKNVTNGDVTIPLPERGIDILAGGSPCFVAGTMVLTPKGYVPIETLRVGDDVVGGSGVIRKVEAVGSRMAEVGKVKVLGRPEITCTPNHPFMCISMKRDNCRNSPTYAKKIPDSGYVATRAEWAVGKYVGRIMVEFQPEPPFPKCFNASFTDIMELAGWYLGDGYIRRFTGKTKKTVVFALCRPEKIEQFKARFHGIINFCETGEGKVAVNCTALANWLSENFGECALNKRLPYWCYTPLRSKPLVAGYFTTDGCHCGGATKFVTVSKALAYGIADILGDASVHVCHVPPKGNICGRIVNQHDWYSVVKADNGGIRTRRVNGRYASIVRNYGTTGTVQRVYNITVGEDHTYIAEGLWTHNCQDVSVAGKRAGMESGSGTRSSLAFEYARLVRELEPRVLVWENVPGVLSSNGGRDFAAFLDSLGELGYSDLAYAVLDAQYVRSEGFPRAVPQRRRRVWVVGVRSVGRAGADFPVAASILSLFPRVCRNTPPRRQAGQGFAAPAGYCVAGDDRMVGGAGFGETGQGFWQSGIQTLRADHQGINWPSNVAVTPCRTRAGGDRGGRGDDTEEGAGTGENGYGFDLQAFGKYGDGGGASTLKSRDWKDATDLAVQTTPSASFDGDDVSATLHKPSGAPGYSDQELFAQKGAYLARCLDITHADEVIREVEGGIAPTMQSRMGTGGNQVPLVMEPHAVAVRTANTQANGHGVADEATHTLDRASGQAVCVGFKAGQSANGGLGEEAEVSPTMSHQPSALEPTVAIGVSFDRRKDAPIIPECAHTECVGTNPGFKNGVAIGLNVCTSPRFPDGGAKEESAGTLAVDHREGVAIGIDGYNQSVTGDASATISGAASDFHHTHGVATMLKVRCGKDTYTKPDGSTGTAGKGPLASEESAFTLAATQDQSLVLRHIVRRLTPTEAERLQAFPDGWTRIPYRGKPADQCPDSPRYKALGNSMSTNCVEWILRRIVAAVRLGMIGE